MYALYAPFKNTYSIKILAADLLEDPRTQARHTHTHTHTHTLTHTHRDIVSSMVQSIICYEGNFIGAYILVDNMYS